MASTITSATPHSAPEAVLTLRLPAGVASLLYQLAEFRNMLDQQSAVVADVLTSGLDTVERLEGIASLETSVLPAWRGKARGSAGPLLQLPGAFVSLLAGDIES